jgi:hypothetical protein
MPPTLRAFCPSAREVSVLLSPRKISGMPMRGVAFSTLDFYGKDFLAHAQSLVAHVNCYRAFRVRFLDYDWTVNDRRRIGVR